MGQSLNLITWDVKPPKDDSHEEWLRFIIQAIDPDQQSTLHFLVGLWSFSIAKEGLTPNQIKTFRPYMDEAQEILQGWQS